MLLCYLTVFLLVSMVCAHTKRRKKQKFVQLQLMNKVQLVSHLISFCVCYLFKWHFRKKWLAERSKKKMHVICLLNQHKTRYFLIQWEFASGFFWRCRKKNYSTISVQFQQARRFSKENALQNECEFLAVPLFFDWTVLRWRQGRRNWTYFHAITFCIFAVK